MTRYLALRVLSVIPTLFGLSLVVFGVTYLIPGDPALIMAGTDTSPDAVARIRQSWGLNEPLYVRYAIWLFHVLQGNLGESYFSRQTVLQLVAGALPITVELATLALAVAVIIAIPTGTLAAVRAGSLFDLGAAAVAFVGLSIPGNGRFCPPVDSRASAMECSPTSRVWCCRPSPWAPSLRPN